MANLTLEQLKKELRDQETRIGKKIEKEVGDLAAMASRGFADIKKELGIRKSDPQLDKMLQRIDTGYIERSIMEQMERANKSLVNKLPEPIAHPKTIIMGSSNGNGNTTPQVKKAESDKNHKEPQDVI